MKISIIGGGNMGGAIARGLSQSSIVAPSEITVSNRGEEKLNELKSFNPSIHTTTDNKEAVKDADVIILAVKPWILDSVSPANHRFGGSGYHIGKIVRIILIGRCGSGYF